MPGPDTAPRMPATPDLPIAQWIHWAAPVTLALGALLAAGVRQSPWPVLVAATRAALGLSMITALVAITARWQQAAPPGALASALTGLLVGFLGWAIGRFSQRYLDGEPGQRRFVIAFLATLAAVGTVIASANLAVIIVAWMASSIALHQLLTFYPDRPAALLVAHKKFLASRLAEACLLGAAVLLYLEWGTLDLDAINRAAGAGEAPATVGIAAVLLVTAVLVKCAQMPLHGWLIQVMEAPTPVSALLHAGVVNLGGYVLIRLAPLLEATPAASALLVIAGSITAVGAGLVMMTRITIKVRLAWSTCSQMGFMLMECGLGLYDLALLHLIAHSLYKAGAFLAAGDAVRDSQVLALARSPGQHATGPGLWPALLAPPAVWLAVLALSEAWHQAAGLPRVPAVGALLIAFGLATLLWQVRVAPVLLAAAGLGIAQLYLAWHWLLSAALHLAPPGVPLALQVWVAAAFGLLYVAQLVIAAGRLPAAHRGYRWAYAGFYLDERFTRLTFRLWPVPLPTPRDFHPEKPA